MNTLHITWQDDGKGRVRAVKALRAASKYLTRELTLREAQGVLEIALREGYALVGETGSAMSMTRAVHEIESHSDGTLTAYPNTDEDALKEAIQATAETLTEPELPDIEKIPTLEGVKVALILQDPAGERLAETVARVVNLYRVTRDPVYREAARALVLAYPFLDGAFRQSEVGAE